MGQSFRFCHLLFSLPGPRVSAVNCQRNLSSGMVRTVKIEPEFLDPVEVKQGIFCFFPLQTKIFAKWLCFEVSMYEWILNTFVDTQAPNVWFVLQKPVSLISSNKLLFRGTLVVEKSCCRVPLTLWLCIINLSGTIHHPQTFSFYVFFFSLQEQGSWKSKKHNKRERAINDLQTFTRPCFVWLYCTDFLDVLVF